MSLMPITNVRVLFGVGLLAFGLLFPFDQGQAAVVKKAKISRKNVAVKQASVAQKKEQKLVSKCNTPAIRKLHVQSLERAKKDAEQYNVHESDASAKLQEAYKTYAEGLEMVWEAMEEPYCGYGSHGVTAVRRSYEKSVNRLRTNFIKEAKASVKK